MTLYLHKDLPRVAYIMYTAISFGNERRRHVGGGKTLPLGYLDQERLGNQTKSGGDLSLLLLIYLLHQLFFDHGTDIACNADMRVGEVAQFCRLQGEGQSLMRAAMSQMQFSARAYHRILKLAHTIADLAGGEEIQHPHLVETLQHKPKITIE